MSLRDTNDLLYVIEIVIETKMNSFTIFLFQLLKLRPEMKWIAGIAISLILTIELIFNKYPACNQIIYDVGVVYLKLCYSVFAAFLFYLVAVYLPKERKRTRGFLILAIVFPLLKEKLKPLLEKY